MKPTGTDVAALIARASPAVRRRDAETLTALMQEVSGREPVVWGSLTWAEGGGSEGMRLTVLS